MGWAVALGVTLFLLELLLQDHGHGVDPVVQGEVSDENNDTDKGLSDFSGWTFQNVFAESRRVGE